jgi:hypothetical protein
MALKSQLFAGDPKLEAAAKSHAAHIVQGARGPHVGKIHRALIALDGATIAAGELAATLYGPTTAKAVLNYKTKRKIINFSYQKQADDIVGIMTMTVLDEEMASRPVPSTPPKRGPNAFFVTADVAAGQTLGDVLSTFGIVGAGQTDALRDPHNAHLHGNAAGAVSDGQLAALTSVPMATATTVVVPIDVDLPVLEFRKLLDMTNGLLPRPIGATGPPTNTHGMRVRFGRNLLAGTSLNWIQTVRKQNNPDKNAPLEFVDVGINNEPFFMHPPPGQPAPREFLDEPSGPIASAPGGGVDFTATTTLAVLVRGHIILAAGKVWRYVITTERTLPGGVIATPPRDATDADFRNQLRILRVGLNQLRMPTGPNLDYVLRPAPGTVIT